MDRSIPVSPNTPPVRPEVSLMIARRTTSPKEKVSSAT